MVSLPDQPAGNSVVGHSGGGNPAYFSLQMPITCGQRGWKGQPLGKLASGGGLPGTLPRVSLIAKLGQRIDQELGIGMHADYSKILSAWSPSSTIFPAYMIHIRSAILACTPISWVTMMIVFCSFLWISLSSWTHPALHDHIQGGGGFIADDDLRLEQGRQGDRHPLAHAARKLVGIRSPEYCAAAPDPAI